jgi:hypothetical protein
MKVPVVRLPSYMIGVLNSRKKRVMAQPISQSKGAGQNPAVDKEKRPEARPPV